MGPRYSVALSGLPRRIDLHNQRSEHLLPRGQKERCAVQRRHSYVTTQFCNPPYRKRRRTTGAATAPASVPPSDADLLDVQRPDRRTDSADFRPRKQKESRGLPTPVTRIG